MKFYCLFLLILIGTGSYSKSHFDAQVCFEKGFEYNELELFNDTVSSINSNGINLNFFYRRDIFKEKLDLVIGLGVRCYDLEATLSNTSLKGSFVKPQFSLGVNYLLTKVSSVALRFQTENVKEFIEFESQATDLLSYSALIEYDYRLVEKLSVLINYKQGFYPMNDIYRMENPSSVISIGFKYNLI